MLCITLGLNSIRVTRNSNNLSNELNQLNKFDQELTSWLKNSELNSNYDLKKLLQYKNSQPKLFFKILSTFIFENNLKNDSLLLDKLNENSTKRFTKEDLNDYKKLKKEFNNLLNNESKSENKSHDEISVLKQNYEEKIEKLIQEKQYLEKSTLKNGYLSFKSENGAEINYVGEIENNLADGYGIAIFSSGFRYEWQWKEGKKEGFGVYYYKNHEKYEGNFLNGKRDGKGTYYFSNGNKYTGEW